MSRKTWISKLQMSAMKTLHLNANIKEMTFNITKKTPILNHFSNKSTQENIYKASRIHAAVMFKYINEHNQQVTLRISMYHRLSDWRSSTNS